MRLIKKINNNFALGIDSKGEKVIVEGRGIGFQKMPCDLADYSMVTRTYYDYDEQHVSLIKDMPQSLLDIANEVHEKLLSSVKGMEVNQNFPFTFADHISFAIERVKKNIQIQLPIYYDLMHLYPMEYQLAQYTLDLIRSKLNVDLPQKEIGGFILSIVNSEMDVGQNSSEETLDSLMNNIASIVENDMGIVVSKEGFNYNRFVSHINYLVDRMAKTEMITTDNGVLYKLLVEKYPRTNACVENIAYYLKKKKKVDLTDEEKLYLILHVNRLCDREKDCNSQEA